MSVLIKGMDMPLGCRECRLMYYGFESGETWCSITDGTLADDYKPIAFDGRPEWCPLGDVPEKHGRLKDVDDLIKFIEDRYDITWESDCYEGGIKDACTDILEEINSMPTIIEAEGAEE